MTTTLAPGVKRGLWTLSSFFPGEGSARPTWLCVCLCGSTRKVRVDALNSGASRSCGCTIAVNHRRAIGEALSSVSSRRPMV